MHMQRAVSVYCCPGEASIECFVALWKCSGAPYSGSHGAEFNGSFC